MSNTGLKTIQLPADRYANSEKKVKKGMMKGGGGAG